jgi:hypothetical protein
MRKALNIVCFSLALVGCDFGSIALAGGLRVFGEDGTYATVDWKEGTILKTGTLWDTKSVPEEGKKELANLSQYAVHSLVTEEDRDLLFLLLGPGRGERYVGYMVVRLSDLTFLHMLRQEMVRALTWLMPNKHLGRLYLGYLSAGDGSATKVYDASTYKEIHKFKDSKFTLQRASCFLRNGTAIYTNRRVFDLKTGKEVREAGLRLLPINCSAGHLLYISSTPGKKTKLVLYDPQSGKVIAEMVTEVEFRYRSSPWLLYDDGRTVIWDEEQLVPMGASLGVKKTGTLEIYDVLDGKKAARVTLKTKPRDLVAYGRILGSLGKERKLLYAAQKGLFLIDLDKGVQEWEITLPFTPVGFAFSESR